MLMERIGRDWAKDGDYRLRRELARLENLDERNAQVSLRCGTLQQGLVIIETCLHSSGLCIPRAPSGTVLTKAIRRGGAAVQCAISAYVRTAPPVTCPSPRELCAIGQSSWRLGGVGSYNGMDGH